MIPGVGSGSKQKENMEHFSPFNVNKMHTSQMSPSDRIAALIAQFSGSMLFVYLHVAWFILWFFLHFDINLLTLIVSLEAIFLSAFIMINQKQSDKKNRLELDHDYKINMQAERDIQALHKKQDTLRQEILDELRKKK